jgi:hypothetical protein
MEAGTYPVISFVQVRHVATMGDVLYLAGRVVGLKGESDHFLAFVQ